MSDDSKKKPMAAIAPFGLRMQPELKDRIEKAAEANGRSMNSEITSRLERSFSTDEFLPQYITDFEKLERGRYENIRSLDTIRHLAIELAARISALEEAQWANDKHEPAEPEEDVDPGLLNALPTPKLHRRSRDIQTRIRNQLPKKD